MAFYDFIYSISGCFKVKKEKLKMHQALNREEMADIFDASSFNPDDNLMIKMTNTLEDIIQTTETFMTAVQDITDIVNEEA